MIKLIKEGKVCEMGKGSIIQLLSKLLLKDVQQIYAIHPTNNNNYINNINNKSYIILY